jgi:hypothetical protein
MQTQRFIRKYLPDAIADLVIGFITPRSRRFKHILEAGYLELLLGYSRYDAGIILKYAIRYNHMEIVNQLLNQKIKMADLVTGIEGACRAGNVRIAMDLIDRDGAMSRRCLLFACRSGNIATIKLALSQRYNSQTTINDCLGEACRSGSIEAIYLLIDEYCANDWDKGLKGACRGNHLDIAMMMINHGVINYIDSFKQCILYDRINLVDTIIPIVNKSPMAKHIYQRIGSTIIAEPKIL